MDQSKYCPCPDNVSAHALAQLESEWVDLCELAGLPCAFAPNNGARA